MRGSSQSKFLNDNHFSMRIEELFDLDWEYIDWENGIKIYAWDSVLTIPKEFELENVGKLEKGKGVQVFLIETSKGGGESNLLLILGLENVLGELGDIPLFILRPQIGLYNLWKLMDFFKKEVKKVGKGLIILFPEFEDNYMDYINSILPTFTEKIYRFKADVERKKL